MKYTRDGLSITLEELRVMLERAENEAQYHNMSSSLLITKGERPRVVQYCCYADCFPIDHTYLAR